MNIWLTLQKAVSGYPAKIGVVDGDQRLTYAQVGERVGALARFFRSRGVGRGDRLSILHVNSHEFLETYFAAAGLGAILNPLNYRLSPAEIAAILRDAGSGWLVAGADFAPLVEAVLKEGTPLEGILWTGPDPSPIPPNTPSLQHSITSAPHDHTPILPYSHTAGYESALAACAGPFEPDGVPEDQVAHLYYTSGTTGRAKGVMLTHRNVCAHALGTIAELRLCDTDVWGHLAAMFHLADAWATFAVTWVGGRHVMLPRFDAGAALSLIERERITLSNLIPTMLNAMVHHPLAGSGDLSSLRAILSGGAPIAPDLVRRIIETLGCDYIQTYGLTETSPYLTLSLLKETMKLLPPEEQLVYKAKTGRPFICVELKVVDEAGRPVAPDWKQVGEIMARGDTITSGYWNLPDETARAFSSGWFRTGDLAVLDTEGFVNIVDRKKDMILTGGENVYSTEVENVLYAHPNVLEAAVFGVPDEQWGEAVRAAIVLQPGQAATEEEIIAFCRQRLAAFKVPKAVDFLPELPRTGSGKIQKRALRDPYWAGRERNV
jgi:fatty-acyl-CoA synthase